MIHELTIGYLDIEAISLRLALASRPLEENVVAQILTEFPGLKVEHRSGYLIVPWHGREDADRGEAFAARLQARTGCLVADRRNGRIIDLAHEKGMARTA